MQSNVFERAIAAVAPGIAVRRAESRARLAAHDAVASYDAAAKSWRTVNRRIASTSANMEILTSLSRLRDVSRDFVRNNEHATSAVSRLTSNVVGAGIIPSIKVDGARLKKRVQALVEEHLDTVAIDFDGRNNLYGLEALATRTMIEAGEALIVRYMPPATMRLPLPFQIRVLEPDYLDHSKDGPRPNGSVLFQGIEFDAAGRRVAYWIFDQHPGGSPNWRIPESKRVPADDVAHLYRVDRPGQVRGVPWGAPCIMTLWDLDDYEDAELMRQKVAACFAVFLKGGAQQNLSQVGGEKTRNDTPIERLEPGLIQRLPSGVEPAFASPPAVTGYEAYTRTHVRKVAMGFGLPYEILTGDLSQVSFISGRMGMIQFNRDIDLWRYNIVIPHVCQAVSRWFVAAASIALGADLRGAGFRMQWTPPRKEMIEPIKEIEASRDAVRSGLSSRSEELRKQGHDPEVIEAEIAEDNKRADALKLKLDSDGRNPLKGPGAPVKDGNDVKESADQ